jgi:hypothetical protein
MTTGDCDSIAPAMADPDTVPDDIDALRAALIAEQQMRREAVRRKRVPLVPRESGY